MVQDKGQYKAIEASLEYAQANCTYVIKCSVNVSVLSPHSRTLFPSTTHSEEEIS
jgi:hypothetical protein